MILTEEQAKTKICHKTLIPVAMSNEFPAYSPTNCIASACMAWHRHVQHVGLCIPEGANSPGPGWMVMGRRRVGEQVFDEYVAVDAETKEITGRCALANLP